MLDEQALYAELEWAPETEMTGVVGARGVAGGHSGAETLWSLIISFVAWRPMGGAVHKEELTLRRRVQREEIATYQARIKAYDVIRVRVRLGDSVSGRRQALLLEFLGREDADAELNAYAQELQQPVTWVDAQFGTFTLNRRINWFSGETHWAEVAVQLTFQAGEPAEMESALAVARRLCADQAEWQRRITGCAAKQLLDLKNDNWLGEEEAEFTAEQFMARMKIEGINVSPHGGFEFWYNDGGMFGGHSITVDGDINEGPDSAEIVG